MRWVRNRDSTNKFLGVVNLRIAEDLLLLTLLDNLTKSHDRDETQHLCPLSKAEYWATTGFVLTGKPNIEKAKEILGWEPEVSLEDCTTHTVNCFLSVVGTWIGPT